MVMLYINAILQKWAALFGHSPDMAKFPGEIEQCLEGNIDYPHAPSFEAVVAA